MNTLEAANLKSGEALWVWDGAAELDAPVRAWDGQWLAATVLEVQTGGSAVSVRVHFESAASITLPAIDIQRRDPSSYGIDKPRAAKPGRIAAAKRILATWSWSGGGRRGPVWTLQVVDGKCSDCGHQVNQLQTCNRCGCSALCNECAEKHEDSCSA